MKGIQMNPTPGAQIAIDKYIALAEKCSAEVGRHEGQLVWMKFHSQSSVEAFVTGIVMMAALKPLSLHPAPSAALAATAAPTESEPKKFGSGVGITE